METMYMESEREVRPKVLSNLGINPHAAKLLIESYIENIAPMPAEVVYNIPIIKPRAPGSKEDAEVVETVQVEVHLKTPGYVGRAKDKEGKGQILDKMALKLMTMSYLHNVRPRPMSFLHYGVEVHILTPGVPSSMYKNIARTVFDAN